MHSNKTAKRKSYFKHCFFTLMAVSLATTVMLTAFLTLNYLKTSINSAAKYNQNLLSQTNYAINQMNQNMECLTQTLFSNRDIVYFLNKKEFDSLTSILVSQAVDSQLVTMPYIKSIYLYNASADTFFSSWTGELSDGEAFEEEAICTMVRDPDFAASYIGIPLAEKGGSTAHSASTISYFAFDKTSSQEDLKNAIIINVYSSALTSSISSMNQFQDSDDMNFIMMNSQGDVIDSVLSPKLESSPGLYPSLPDTLVKEGPGRLYVNIGRTKYLASVTLANENDWYLISLTPVKTLFHDVILSSLAGGAIMVTLILLCCILCLYSAKKLNSPILAITNIMNGKKTEDTLDSLQGTDEFRLILSSFETIREQNLQLTRMKESNGDSLSQNCLNMLVTGNQTDSPEHILQKLQQTGLSYLSEKPLCMVMMKIDNYRTFCSQNNPNELWVLRFAITNIMDEIIRRSFTGNVLDRDNDKFILILGCDDGKSPKELFKMVEVLILELQSNMKQHMKLTMSAAYSSVFRGPDHLAAIADNLEEALQLKMKYGHNCMISPYIRSESNPDMYAFPTAKASQLILLVTCEKCSQAQQLLKQMVTQLLEYDYNEILSGSIQLLYTLYMGVEKKYPELRENVTLLLKDSLSQLQDAEIGSDVSSLLKDYVAKLCASVSTSLNESSQDKVSSLIKRICEITEKEYANSDLCLSYISDEIGLTSNYLGKVFKSTMNISVSQYILDYRLDVLGKYLKETDLPVNSLLEKVGLEKNNYFYTQFRKHFGMSSMEYRARAEE